MSHCVFYLQAIPGGNNLPCFIDAGDSPTLFCWENYQTVTLTLPGRCFFSPTFFCYLDAIRNRYVESKVKCYSDWLMNGQNLTLKATKQYPSLYLKVIKRDFSPKSSVPTFNIGVKIVYPYGKLSHF